MIVSIFLKEERKEEVMRKDNYNYLTQYLDIKIEKTGIFKLSKLNWKKY